MSIKQIALRTLVLGAIAASATVAAKADTLDFTLTGQGTDITFTLPSDPTVFAFSKVDGEFELENIVLDVNGQQETEDVDFYTKAEGGGIEADTPNFGFLLFLLDGKQLFTGGVSDPTLKTGDFTLTSIDGDYNLSITDASAVTPEPSSMLLLATGMFGLLGAGVAKRYAA